MKQLKGDAWEFINRSKHRRCISSIPQLNGNSTKFSLSTWTRRVIKSPQTKLLHSQLYWWTSIYCLVFPGAIYCTYYWRPAKSSLFSIFFCRFLWRFYYPSSMSFLAIFGHMAPFSTHIACPISSSFSIHIHCVWVSPWTHLSSPSISHVSTTSSSVSPSRSPHYLSSSSSI